MVLMRPFGCGYQIICVPICVDLSTMLYFFGSSVWEVGAAMINGDVKDLFGRNEGSWHQQEGKEDMKLVGVRKED